MFYASDCIFKYFFSNLELYIGTIKKYILYFLFFVVLRSIHKQQGTRFNIFEFRKSPNGGTQRHALFLYQNQELKIIHHHLICYLPLNFLTAPGYVALHDCAVSQELPSMHHVTLEWSTYEDNVLTMECRCLLFAQFSTYSVKQQNQTILDRENKNNSLQ